MKLSLWAWVTRTKYHRLDRLSRLFLRVLEAGNSKVKLSADLVSVRSDLLALQMAASSPSPHKASPQCMHMERVREHSHVSSSFCKSPIPSWGTTSIVWTYYLAHLHIPSHWWSGFQDMNLKGINIQSIRNSPIFYIKVQKKDSSL